MTAILGILGALGFAAGGGFVAALWWAVRDGAV